MRNLGRNIHEEPIIFTFFEKFIESVYLKKLIELGIVGREYSADSKTKEKANTNRGTYRLTGNFFRFWYAFCFVNFSQLEDGDVDGVFKYVIEPALNEYASFSFEDIAEQLKSYFGNMISSAI